METNFRGLNPVFHIKKILVLALFLLFFGSFSVFAAESLFVQKIEWKSNASVLEYKVEVQNIAGGKSQTIKTENSSLELSLAPGKYRYRVTAYDFLGKEASVSEWTNFEVYKANKPKITNIERNVKIPKDENSLSISVDISDVNANTKFELVNESLQGSVDITEKQNLGKGSETENIKKLNFSNVPEGRWRLKVTNASGLSSLSDVIEISGEKMALITDAELEKLREEKEKALAEAEKKLKEEREAFEEERKKYEDEIEELNERYAKESEKLAKEEWKAAHPYKWKDVIFEAGLGFTMSPYDGSIKKYTDKNTAVPILAKIAWLPFKTETNKFGLQISGTVFDFVARKDMYKLALEYSLFDLQAVWHKKLSKKTYLAVKGGMGLANISKKTHYYEGSSSRSKHSDADYTYPGFCAGVSLFFTPWKFIVFETGVDYNHVMATDMTTGFITPYACVGFRF